MTFEALIKKEEGFRREWRKVLERVQEERREIEKSGEVLVPAQRLNNVGSELSKARELARQAGDTQRAAAECGVECDEQNTQIMEQMIKRQAELGSQMNALEAWASRCRSGGEQSEPGSTMAINEAGSQL